MVIRVEIANNKVTYFEGKKAESYDDFIQKAMPGYKTIISKTPILISETLLIILNPNILIVGCGTGTETLELAKSIRKCNITACDPSLGMIEIAKKKLEKYKNVEILHSLVDNLSLDKKYNVATLFLVLHFISDDGEKLNLLKQISSRLEPKGVLYLWDISDNREDLKDNIKKLKPLFLKNLSLERWNSFEDTILNKLYTLDDKRLYELAEESGFEKPILMQENIINKYWKLKLKN